jgi:hypothetical protein
LVLGSVFDVPGFMFGPCMTRRRICDARRTIPHFQGNFDGKPQEPNHEIEHEQRTEKAEE